MKAFVCTAVISAALASCAPVPRLPANPDAELISIELSPGFGGVNAYKLDVASNGRARLRWHNQSRDWSAENWQIRNLRVSAEKFAAFKAKLLPYRPVGQRLIVEESADCGEAVSDQEQITVRWRDGGKEALLSYCYGCDRKRNLALVETLTEAPKSLVPLDLAKLTIW